MSISFVEDLCWVTCFLFFHFLNCGFVFLWCLTGVLSESRDASAKVLWSIFLCSYKLRYVGSETHRHLGTIGLSYSRARTCQLSITLSSCLYYSFRKFYRRVFVCASQALLSICDLFLSWCGNRR